MAEFEIKANAKINLLTEHEARRAFTDALVELYRGVRYVRRSLPTTAVDASGNLNVTSNDAGPDGGFSWDVGRISVFGLSGTETVNVFVNEATPTNYVGTISRTTGILVLTDRSLVLNPNDRLVVAGSGLTVAENITAIISASELPVEIAWQFM